MFNGYYDLFLFVNDVHTWDGTWKLVIQFEEKNKTFHILKYQYKMLHKSLVEVINWWSCNFNINLYIITLTFCLAIKMIRCSKIVWQLYLTWSVSSIARKMLSNRVLACAQLNQVQSLSFHMILQVSQVPVKPGVMICNHFGLIAFQLVLKFFLNPLIC